MSNLIVVQGKYASSDYRDIKALGIGGSGSDLALAMAQHIKDSDTGLWVPMETDHLVGLTVPSTLNAGTAAAGTAAAAIGTAAVSGVLVQADPGGTVDVYVGNASAQVVRLLPGMSVTIQISNVNAIYAKTLSGTCRVNWLAS